jgi:hypothetical protein
LTGVYNLYYEKNGRAVQGDFLFCRTEYRKAATVL